MTCIDKTEYPSIRWRWRIFNTEGFMGYLNMTCDELAQVAATFKCVVDLEHGSLELL